MKYVVIALLALILGGLIGRAIWSEKKEQPVDPVQVIVTQLKTHAIVAHERQLAIWYRACQTVWGKTPEIFIAWPAKLSYEIELSDVQVTRAGNVIKVRTAAIHPNEPAVPTDFVNYLSTTSIFTFANEQELVNHEINKASPIARYLTSYFLARDPSLQGDFADELQRLVEHLAAALGVQAARVEVDVPKPQFVWHPMPKLELCSGTSALVNGQPFAQDEQGSTTPVRFHPPQPLRAGAPPAGNDAPKGIASVYGAGVAPKQ